MFEPSTIRKVALAVASLALCAPAAAASADEPTAPQVVHAWYGTVKDVRGTVLELTLRTGKVVDVDLRRPLADHRMVLLTPTRPIIVKGMLDGSVIRAQVILRSHSMPEYWPPDH